MRSACSGLGSGVPRSGTTPNPSPQPTSPGEYRVARPVPGGWSAAATNDVQLGRDVSKRPQLGGLELQGDQRFNRRRVGIQ